MNFRQIHFCAEQIIEQFLRTNWLNEFESVDTTDFRNRRHGLFKNILISQNNNDRANKWKKGNHGQWNLTHSCSKGADNSGTYALEYGHFVKFEIKGESHLIKLMENDKLLSSISLDPNWQESTIEDFRRGKEEFLQGNPGDWFVVEESEYQLYIHFLTSLFSTNEVDDKDKDEFEPFYTTYLALFGAYNDISITDKAKTVIETTMGAMIFYMPQSAEKSWSKRISHQCFLESLRKKGYKKVKDHEIPRKLAAIICLQRNEPLSLNEFRNHYWSRFSGFTYVTTDENMRLVNWYLDEANKNEEGQYDYIKALNTLQIKYLSLPDDFVHKRINRLISSVRENIRIDHTVWTPELEELILNKIQEN